tara:strand:+ start:345 stop:1586 length:1242 start_codon:yes stop_codon:yes gene_type:complete
MKDILNIRAENYPNKTSIIFEDKAISYKKFNYMVNNTISIINKEIGEYIGIQIQNKLKLLVSIIAINRTKKIPILFPYYPNIKDYIDSAGFPILFTDNDIIINDNKNDQQPIFYNKNNIQVVIFTSGSTGVPKPCQLSFDNLYQSSLLWNDVMKFNRSDVYLNHMPILHVSGLCIYFRAMYNNFTMVLSDFDTINYSEYLKSYQINIISMVPYMLKKIINENNTAAFKQLKAIIIGGSSIEDELLDLIKKNRIPAYISYGMTETSSGIAGFWANKDVMYSPHNNVNINVDNNKIFIKSKTVMHGYINSEKNGGIFKTNDSGSQNSRGQFYVNQRTDGIVNSGGEKFSRKYTEELIEKLTEVNNCTIKIINDIKWGDSIHAYIKLNTTIDTLELHDKLKNIMPNYMLPKKIIIL